MNMFKKNGGFTLVELIVVIAILAILAAVAIPAYSGYISKAQEANDYTALDSLKTATVFAVTEEDYNATVTKIVVTKTTVTVDYNTTSEGGNQTGVTSLTSEIFKLAGITEFKFSSDNNTATLDLTADEPKWDLDKK